MNDKPTDDAILEFPPHGLPERWRDAWPSLTPEQRRALYNITESHVRRLADAAFDYQKDMSAFEYDYNKALMDIEYNRQKNALWQQTYKDNTD